ncbi:hypothetical protein SALBM311S_10837 [Streptomyces alboniger]
MTAYDVVGTGERAGVDGAPGKGPYQLLHEQVGADARHGAARIPGLLGDDQVTGVHTGGQPGAEARGQDGGPVERGVGQESGDSRSAAFGPMPVRGAVTGPSAPSRSPLRRARCSMPSAQAISSRGRSGLGILISRLRPRRTALRGRTGRGR